MNRTVVIVTHRLSTARWAERLVLIEDGTVRADGASRDLLESQGRVLEVFGEQTRQ